MRCVQTTPSGGMTRSVQRLAKRRPRSPFAVSDEALTEAAQPDLRPPGRSAGPPPGRTKRIAAQTLNQAEANALCQSSRSRARSRCRRRRRARRHAHAVASLFQGDAQAAAAMRDADAGQDDRAVLRGGEAEPQRHPRRSLDGSTVAGRAARAHLDIWHASPNGRYSDESVEGTSGTKYLRGYQVSDAAGTVRFTTVYPGWYSGRTSTSMFASAPSTRVET